MKKKNRHINKYLHDRLPEPEVQADDAWMQMNDMLNALPGGNVQAGKAAKWTAKLVKLKGAISIGLIATAVAVVVVYKTLTPTTHISSRGSAEKPLISPVNPADSLQNIENQENKTLKIDNEELSFVPDPPIKRLLDLASAPGREPSKPTVTAIGKAHVTRHAAASENHQNQVNNITKRRSRSDKPPGSWRYREEQEIPPLSVKSGIDRNLISQLIAKNRGVGSAPAINAPLKTELSTDNSSSFAVQRLKSRGAHFPVYDPGLKNKIIQNISIQPANATENKKTADNQVHFGLEWSVNSSLKTTSYVATGADSINKVARLLIPGIFVAKTWQRHSLTFSFSPYQSYFGDTKKISQQIDSTLSTDSLKGYNNVRLIKTVGMNFSLQYQYHVSRLLALNAGGSYSMFSGVLVRKEIQTATGNLLAGPLATMKKSDNLSTYINPRLFALKAGISFTPGRFQAGLNVIVPLSNVSRSSEFPVKALNGQFYLRFLVW